MNGAPAPVRHMQELDEIRLLGRPLAAAEDLDAYQLLAGFERWPTWMWANHEVAGFLAWLREWNLARPDHLRTGFYGLDVYSLWDSLREIFAWLEANAARRPSCRPARLALLRAVRGGPAPVRVEHAAGSGILRDGCGGPAGRSAAPDARPGQG